LLHMSEPVLPVILGQLPDPDEPEFREMSVYESGVADEAAKASPGRHAEPWLNVLEAHEPANLPAIDYALAHPELGPRIHGRVLDLAAGTCWVSAKLSRLGRVAEVVALDLSRRFLTTVGVRMIQCFEGDIAKIKFAASSFNRIPFEAESFDCVFLVAAIHHSLSPIKTLIEARRVLKPGGTLIVLEHPSSVVGVRANRDKSLALSRSTQATELCYTRGEFEYMIRHAGFGDLSFRPFPPEASTFLRNLVRQTLRRTGLEDLLRPPLYLIDARR
jgi:SAM-dependent methyltransferase